MTLIFLSNCQSTQLSNKRIQKTIHKQVTIFFNQYAKDAIHNRALRLSQDIGLDSLQYVELVEWSQWETTIIQPRRDSVLTFSTSTFFSKEEKEGICACIEHQNATPSCKKLMRPITEKIHQEADKLLASLAVAMVTKTLNEKWISKNATPKNCAPLRSGIFYYLTPVHKDRVEVERYKDGQVETLSSQVSRYQIIWEDYDHYQLIGLEQEKGFKVDVEIFHVQPTYYIFKLKLPSTTDEANYILGRINRAEKKS
ncbi:MAG: hypothetical protein ACRBFS_05755 [Aureispira sp.]